MEETIKVELNLDKARRWLAEYDDDLNEYIYQEIDKAVQSYDYDQQRSSRSDHQS